MADSDRDVTGILHRAAAGDADAAERLWAATYAQLRSIAARQLGAERSDHTLSPTGLVHEAYLRLVAQDGVAWNDRAHFFRIAARMCRRILVDHARRRGALRRGGDQVPSPLDTQLAERIPDGGGDSPETLVALDEALDRLAEVSPRLESVVELRYFAGLTEDEIATALEVTPRTVRRDWVKARAFLYDAIFGAGPASPDGTGATDSEVG
jgi:RNA polymerase sigma factor (TIGR02999 family)